MTRRITILFALTTVLFAQDKKTMKLSPQEQPILEQIRGLRNLPDAKRGPVTAQLALEIRALPASPQKLMLIGSLANLATEGDFGKQTLQEVASTLYETLREQAATSTGGMPEQPYITLAQLVRYEGAKVPMTDPLLNAAMARLQAEEQNRAKADFTLNDIQGKSWTLHDLKGKVVLVNFWATWCPPCRKEMPDLEAIYKEFSPKGLVVLAISDEDAAKVTPFIADKKYTYPILLDPGGKVAKLMAVDGIPKTYIYDRGGKLAAQAIDMRTRRQLLEMLSHAGI